MDTANETGVARLDRGDETRQRLIAAATEVFGRLGFEAASTRAIADAAGANLAAIPYHFGGKEGLYLAVADAIAAGMLAQLGPVLDAIEAGFRADQPRAAVLATMRDRKSVV